MAANGERPIDVGLKIRTHPAMTVTSNLKMRNAKSCSLTYSGAKIQALYMKLNDKDLLKKNMQAVIRLLDDAEKFHGRPKRPSYEDLNACLVYRDVSPELILQFLERHEFSAANIRFTAKMISDYISDLRKVGELSKWSVAVMSSKSGAPLDLGSDRRVFMVDRSVMKMTRSERDPSASHIKVITAPRDEVVDLEDVLIGRGLSTSSKDGPFEPPGVLTETSIRQHMRPADRGLLMLYPINPNIEITTAEVQRYLAEPPQTMPLKAVSNLMGVAFVFPKSNSSQSSYRYVVNGTI